MLGSANPDAAKATEYTVRQLLDDFSAGFGSELAGQPEVDAEIRATIGRAYWRLGSPDRAEPHLMRALELRRGLFGPNHEKVAESQVDLAWCRHEQQRLPEAEAAAREALRIYGVRGASGLPVIQAHVVLQRVLLNSRPDEAVSVAKRALALVKTSGAEYPEIATILHALADTYNGQENYVEAEQVARQAVEMHRRLHGPEHPETAWGLRTLGAALALQGKYAEAESTLREALAIFRQRYSGSHVSIDSTLGGLQQIYEAQGDQAKLQQLKAEWAVPQNPHANQPPNDQGQAPDPEP
jgi:tetratricopeptide (TPR) repeat protein